MATKSKPPVTIWQRVELPSWAKWTAIDAFGVFIAFEYKPMRVCEYWRTSGGRKRDILQFDGQKYKGWRKSLTEIDPVATVPGPLD